MHATNKAHASIPADTYHAARQIYNLQHIYLRIGDQYDVILRKADVRPLDSQPGPGEEVNSRLSLVTAFQFAEFLPDRVASDASRNRIDWKYALRLPVHHPGIAARAMCEFRAHVYGSAHAVSVFDHLLDPLYSIGLFESTDQAPKAAEVLATVCQITRLHQLHMGMKEALICLAANATNWLLENMPPYWYARYKTGPLSRQSFSNCQDLEDEARKLGGDIQFLLRALDRQNQEQIEALVEIQRIRWLFQESFLINGGQVQWRRPGCGFCTQNKLGETNA